MVTTYVLVASSHNGNNASGSKLLNGTVDSVRARTAQRHVHDGLASEALFLDIGHDKVQALKDTRVGTATILAQDLDAHELNFLGDAKGSTTNSTSDM